MAAEDIIVEDNAGKEEENKTLVKTTSTSDNSISGSGFNAMLEQFDKVMEEITKKYEGTIKQLTDKLSEKEEEIKKQKDITAQIVMGSSVKSNSVTDFASSDFEDVDWDKETHNYFSKLDARIYGIKER